MRACVLAGRAAGVLSFPALTRRGSYYTQVLAADPTNATALEETKMMASLRAFKQNAVSAMEGGLLNNALSLLVRRCWPATRRGSHHKCADTTPDGQPSGAAGPRA